MTTIHLQDLAHAGREPPVPVRLVLDRDKAPEVGAWLRVLPGKRYVGRATWKGRQVLIKVFVGPGAARMANAERAGIERLRRTELPTPRMLGADTEGAGQAAWVMTAFFPAARPLSQAAGLSVEGLSGLPGCPEALLTASRTIARMHNAGLMQDDIHPDNFLYHKNDCLVVDAAEVQSIPRIKALARITRNTGKWLAQLPENWWAPVLRAYSSQADHCPDHHLDYERVREQAIRWRAWRARNLGLKAMRDCSLFRVHGTPTRFVSCWRSEYDDLAPILEAPDRAMADCHLLKDGGTATVGLLIRNGRRLVIKRYNIKNRWHRLRRLLRPSRARHSWIAGHRLRTLGIDTPRPVAMIEERRWIFRGRGFLITEYCPGKDLIEMGQDKKAGEPAVIEAIVERIARVFALFRRYHITHGDFKATNLLWDGELSIIDLDAVSFFRSKFRWKRSYHKDIDRLSRNWPAGSPMRRLLSDALVKS
uniref:Lipopolysaccharide kinase (Kdo/WaaP) family protein n=1 Tax=Candidatus Kentrum sp. FM TaxID=2126340 RepID=A0A450TIM4_9GAMM|nr:MAG: Lipopolysaccharide kinase (Kdo/WaaP) family protein [Candidatus Kentron sp. FM]VFJ67113.1 MAG: Lipopolysaccharide kinase (Kdo/WaaP) family protein [Candidatus Kentron sp. FM]VFK12667.1 MAG: Lipopolysaccharide kinase (Kdo/WaaP) family protein [Candidatus Kentron sp. FM]